MKEIWQNGRTTTCDVNGITGTIIDLGNGSPNPYVWEVNIFLDFGVCATLEQAKSELLAQLKKINQS
jgi:hypothetical protein